MLGVFDELLKSFAIILLKSKVEESRDNYSRDSKLPVRRPSIRNKHVEKCKNAGTQFLFGLNITLRSANKFVDPET